MSLIDELLNADAKAASEKETGEFRSERLAKILKKDAAVPVKVRALNPRRINDFLAYQERRDGSTDRSKSYDAGLMVCVEGCIEPDLTDKDLQAHFGCASAKDLAELLFLSETNDLAGKILAISGFGSDEDDEGDILKNS